MYEGMPEIMGGNFTMTTIALGSAFGGSGNAMNNYSSKAFDRLLANREIIAQRIESKYSGLKYPDVGFIHDQGLGGMPYNPGTDNVNGVNRNSADVLIPAFLAAAISSGSVLVLAAIMGIPGPSVWVEAFNFIIS